MAKSPDKILKDAATLFKSRNAEYGSCYSRHGDIMQAFFPNGIKLKTERDFMMYSLFETCAGKMNRMAENMTKGTLHTDSADDIMVYLAMARELDELFGPNPTKAKKVENTESAIANMA